MYRLARYADPTSPIDKPSRDIFIPLSAPLGRRGGGLGVGLGVGRLEGRGVGLGVGRLEGRGGGRGGERVGGGALHRFSAASIALFIITMRA